MSQGENKEYCDQVIQEILEQWDKSMYGKTTNELEGNDDELVKSRGVS